ncbi:Uncharacterized protein Fot_32663 [Forsythia ovata]|uniref:Uncharacterized protein n=1 Tax=Forsythia ovata TaxID=205694 RepID=A0ABD1T8F8_9LAMI
MESCLGILKNPCARSPNQDQILGKYWHSFGFSSRILARAASGAPQKASPDGEIELCKWLKNERFRRENRQDELKKRSEHPEDSDFNPKRQRDETPEVVVSKEGEVPRKKQNR